MAVGIKVDEQYTDYIFAYHIKEAYRKKLNEKLRNGKISKLDNCIIIEDTYYHYWGEDGGPSMAKEILKLIDSENGLNFRDLTLDKYNNDYYYLNLIAMYTYGNNIGEYTINEAKKIMNHYNIKNAEISAYMKNDLNSSSNIRCCIVDGKEVTCEIGELDELMVDKNDYVILDGED